jgi:hypothetical protein
MGIHNPEEEPGIIVPGEPLFLGHSTVNGDGGEVLFDQQLGHGDTALHGLHEDHHLGKKVLDKDIILDRV